MLTRNEDSVSNKQKIENKNSVGETQKEGIMDQGEGLIIRASSHEQRYTGIYKGEKKRKGSLSHWGDAAVRVVVE